MDKTAYYVQELEDGWIRKSMLLAWRWCPRSFKIQYIDGLPSTQSEVMAMGTAFHDFASFFHELFDVYQFESFTSLADLIAWLLAYIPDDTFPILKLYIERFIQFEARRYWYFCRTLSNSDEHYKPRHVELQLRHKFGDEQYGRAGSIDSVYRINNGDGTVTVRIREYKVSRKLNISDVRYQLAFYKSVIERLELFGADTVNYKYELYNPLLDNGVFPLEHGTYERTRNGIYAEYWFYENALKKTSTNLEKSIHMFIEALESGYFPKKKKSEIEYSCKYCERYAMCWGAY